MDFVPFDDELGERIYNEVSAQAWDEWLKTSPRFINTYRLDLSDPQHQAFLRDQMEIYFGFKEGDMAGTAWRPPEH